MAISDVLFEAREDILGYLDNGGYGGYGGRKHWAGIAAVVLAMDRLRLSPGYDIHPDCAPPTFPDDPMEYLDKIMAERAAEVKAATPDAA